MAVHHLTYLDLTLKQRAQAAARVREQIRVTMANPFLTADQQAALSAQVARLHHWEHGHLPVGAPLSLG